MKTPAVEMVGFSRATDPGRLAMGNPPCNSDRISLLKVDTRSICQKNKIERYYKKLSQTP